MKNEIFKKGMVYAIVVLFIGVSIIPLTGSKSVDKTPGSDDTAYIGNFYNRTIISIYPPSQTVETGETFTASYYIEPADWIIEANFMEISFDPTLLQANSVSKGTFFGGHEIMFSGGTIDNVAGTISDGYAFVLVGDAVNSPGSEFVITFTAQQLNGTSAIDLEGVHVSGEYPPIVYDGSVTVDAAPPEINNVMFTTSDPLDTDIGWENFTCTVTDNIGVDEVKLVLIGDTTIEYPMVKDGDDYYCNITISPGDEYTYHIWAKDTSDNEITSASQPFDLPSNCDVDMNGQAYFEDLVAIVMRYGETESPGWVREDVDNNGEVYFDDLVAVAMHYGEEW